MFTCYIFLSFYFQPVIDLKWISYRKHCWVFYFIHSAYLCLLIGIFLPLTFEIIIVFELKSAILLFVFWLFLLFSNTLLLLFCQLHEHFLGSHHNLFVVLLNILFCMVLLVVAKSIIVYIHNLSQSAVISVLPLPMNCSNLTSIEVHIFPPHF